MARVFVDANYFIQFANKSPETDATDLFHNHQLFVSVLTCHILFYVNKIKVPDDDTISYISDFNLTSLGAATINKAMLGPTNDLEDNIQLHSAAKANCNYFLTNDKRLLQMSYFGKTRILNSLAGTAIIPPSPKTGSNH